ncbi:MAG: gamma-glutamyltransferase [Candidatus Krumholzibacteriota bacterium]|nr:gamma-glutamyltransferase [Candidatus Krumholzibacteriota bacterium]
MSALGGIVRRRSASALFAAIISLILFSGWPRAYDRPAGEMYASRSEVLASEGMVCAAQPLAAQIGIDILKKGGSAVDAAIAVNAALGLMEPVSSGVGGDLFAIVWDAETQKLYGLNASGRAPRLLNIEEVKKKGYSEIPYTGVLPQTVPGCVDGWFELHGRFGKLDMKEILAPAIRYAEKGFPVTEIIAHYWKIGGERLKDQPNFAKTYLPGGRAPLKGEVFKNPDLAHTYSLLAERGRDAFYRGEIAETIDKFERRIGGYLRLKDFENHTSTWVEPVSTGYRGYNLWELPPNGQGIAALQILNIIEAFDLEAMGHNSSEYLHHLIEAKKIAFEDRASYYADPEFSDIPVDKLISKEYARGRRKLLNPEKALKAINPGDIILENGETTYLAVSDSERNFVSLIQSNYAGFGSGPVPDGLGFCLQDRGALFNLDPEHPNSLEPGKRPFHTIIPAMVTRKGMPVFAFGVMGGSMQPQGHVQILCNIIDFGMGIQEAGDAPRFRHLGSSQPTGRKMSAGGRVALESGIGREVIRELIEKGHRIIKESGGFGGYQGIWWDHRNDILIGGSESRKDGCAIGY